MFLDLGTSSTKGWDAEYALTSLCAGSANSFAASQSEGLEDICKVGIADSDDLLHVLQILCALQIFG
jgi:hypothetical protein